MFGAGLAVDHFVSKNSGKKLSKLQSDILDYSKNIPNSEEDGDAIVSDIKSRASNLIKSHKRNLNLGYGGLAAAGALGIGGKYLVDKRKSVDKDKKNK